MSKTIYCNICGQFVFDPCQKCRADALEVKVAELELMCRDLAYAEQEGQKRIAAGLKLTRALRAILGPDDG